MFILYEKMRFLFSSYQHAVINQLLSYLERFKPLVAPPHRCNDICL